MHSVDWFVAGAIVVATWLARKSRKMLLAFMIVSAIVATSLIVLMFWMIERHGIVSLYPYSGLIVRSSLMLALLSILSLNFLARAPRLSSETRGD